MGKRRGMAGVVGFIPPRQKMAHGLTHEAGECGRQGQRRQGSEAESSWTRTNTQQVTGRQKMHHWIQKNEQQWQTFRGLEGYQSLPVRSGHKLRRAATGPTPTYKNVPEAFLLFRVRGQAGQGVGGEGYEQGTERKETARKANKRQGGPGAKKTTRKLARVERPTGRQTGKLTAEARSTPKELEYKKGSSTRTTKTTRTSSLQQQRVE